MYLPGGSIPGGCSCNVIHVIQSSVAVRSLLPSGTGCTCYLKPGCIFATQDYNEDYIPSFRGI